MPSREPVSDVIIDPSASSMAEHGTPLALPIYTACFGALTGCCYRFAVGRYYFGLLLEQGYFVDFVFVAVAEGEFVEGSVVAAYDFVF